MHGMTKLLTVDGRSISLYSLGLFDGLDGIDRIDSAHHRISLQARLPATLVAGYPAGPQARSVAALAPDRALLVPLVRGRHGCDRFAAALGAQQDGRHLVPDPRFVPAVELGRYHPNRAVALGQAAPRRPRAPNPQDAGDDPALVVVRPPGARPRRRQQRLQPFPLPLGQIKTSHRPRSGHPGPMQPI